MESTTTPKNWLDVWLRHWNVTYGCVQELPTNCLTNSVGKELLPFQKVICCCLLGLHVTCLPILKHVPFFDFLGKKIAHFLHDYHSSSFPYLAFEESNGEHNQLTTQQIQNLVGRTQTYALGGMHIMRISFWGLNHGADARDILRKDPMHAFDHGVSEQMIKSTVIELQKLERALGMSKNRLVTRFVKCLTLQCANNIQIAQHITLLRFKRRDVLEFVETLA